MKFSPARSILFALALSFGTTLSTHAQTPAAPVGAGIEHSILYQQDGRFAAWPANGGIWMWNNEILVGFVEAKYAESRGLHTYDQKSARHSTAAKRGPSRMLTTRAKRPSPMTTPLPPTRPS
jgi:hypothetical protein